MEDLFILAALGGIFLISLIPAITLGYFQKSESVITFFAMVIAPLALLVPTTIWGLTHYGKFAWAPLAMVFNISGFFAVFGLLSGFLIVRAFRGKAGPPK